MFAINKKQMLGIFTMLIVLSATVAEAGFPCLRNNSSNDCCECQERSRRAKPPMPPFDRPFPLGQVSDAFWETQQTNAEAADFIMYDYEFVGETATLNPLGRDHMTQIARRLPHVPFPIVIEMSQKTNDPKENQRLMTIDETRRANVVMWLQKFYADDPTMNPEQIANRVVVAPDFVHPMRADMAIQDLHNAANARHSHGHSRR